MALYKLGADDLFDTGEPEEHSIAIDLSSGPVPGHQVENRIEPSAADRRGQSEQRGKIGDAGREIRIADPFVKQSCLGQNVTGRNVLRVRLVCARKIGDGGLRKSVAERPEGGHADKRIAQVTGPEN